MQTISIVTSMYYSEKYIEEYYNRTKASLIDLNVNYEFIFVNDASPDKSTDIVKKLIKQDLRVKLIDLSRNFGQYAAMFAGLKFAKGEYVFINDCDLEAKPELVASFYKTIKTNDDIDVVYGVVKERAGGFVKRVLGGLFFKLLISSSEFKFPINQAWSRLMKKNYVDNLLKFNEVETLPCGIMFLNGFRQEPYPIDKNYKGTTTYSPMERFKHALIGITSFSAKPLLLIALLGFGIFSLSLVFIVYILTKKIFFTSYQTGWSSIISSIWCVGGLIIFCLGVIGYYIAKIFNQTKNRPLYIIKSVSDNV